MFADDAPIMYFEKDCPIYDQSAITKQWLSFLKETGVSLEYVKNYLEFEVPFGNNIFTFWLSKELVAKIAVSGILV